MTGRRVAMKKLHRKNLGDRRHVDSITREARVQALLERPGIPIVYDLDRDVIGCPFYVMNVIDGVCLREVLHHLRLGDQEWIRSFPLLKLVNKLADMLEILHGAHELGILHLDIKPENVMLDRTGQTWLIDWGTSRLVDEELGNADPATSLPVRRPNSAERSTHVNERRQFTGSPVYASPEIIRGNTVDFASDVYSAGTVLYDLLVLNTMVRGSTHFEAMRNACEGRHTAPSTCTLRKRIPDCFVRIWQKSTQIDPTQRYRNAGRMAEEIRQACQMLRASGNTHDFDEITPDIG